MLNALRRGSVKFRDSLRYSAASREALAHLLALKGRFVDGDRRRDVLLRAYRLTDRRPLLEDLSRRLEPFLAGRAADPRLGPSEVGGAYSGLRTRPGLDRTIVLKAPGPGGEKGVILVWLEPNWLRIMAGCDDLEALEDRYTLIFSTGWSPTDYHLVALALRSFRGTVFFQSCNYAEIPRYEALSPRIRCLSMLPCDWINPEYYEPRPFDRREIDILMVANWAPFKRHWHFFEALARMPRDLRVKMIGQNEGPHTLESVRKQARLFGVKQDIDFAQDLPIEGVQECQCNSKISLILSRREGCCVAVVESLFADSPVALLKDAHVGPRAYINDQTGMLLEHARLDRQLMRFLETAAQCRARAWAIDNISCYHSIGKLNALLRDDARATGCPWTTDLKVPCWRPYPAYVNPEDAEALRPAYDWLRERFPAVFTDQLIHSVVKPRPRVLVAQ
jgi:glycosyltransferase involved in cell wall biosynthesis